MSNELQAAHTDLSATIGDLQAARQVASWAVDLLTDARRARATELVCKIDDCIAFAQRLCTVVEGDRRQELLTGGQ
jgi:hypothetical protein